MKAVLRVHVHPRARSERLSGFRADGSLALAVAAAPEGGRANLAVAAMLAERLGVPRARVAVVRGRSSRDKLVEVDGMDGAELKRRLEAVLAGRGADDDE